MPFTLVQLSDPHIGADWGGGDPVARLAATVQAARALRPDAVLVTGDLADHAADAEYERLKELLAPLGAPLHVLGGNHDDRDQLRRHFGGSGGDGPYQHAATAGPLRLVALDSTIPGQDGGELDPERLAWLDAALAAEPDAPTIVALHHPPLTTGIPAMDAIGLPPDARRALAAVGERHPQVRRIVGGHMHRAIAAELAGRAVLAVPSTYVQARLDFRTEEVELTNEAAGFAVHALRDGELVSHVCSVAP